MNRYVDIHGSEESKYLQTRGIERRAELITIPFIDGRGACTGEGSKTE